MVHAAAGYARQKNRLSTLACTTSVGPGATNMVTGAALATINRLPVLLLPGDIFATRRGRPGAAGARGPALATTSRSTTASGPCRATSTASTGPSSSPAALLAAMRVLTDPAETGAVTLALPQDVQAEALRLARRAVRAARLARAPRRSPEPAALAEAAALLRGARRPLIVAGGGVIYAEATEALRRARRGDRHPGRRDPGRQGLAALRPPAVRSARSAPPARRPPTRSPARPTSSSASAPAGATSRPPRAALFADPDVRFINLNVAAVRRAQARRPAAGRATPARASRRSPRRSPATRVDDATERARRLAAELGRDRSSAPTRSATTPLPAQSEVIGAVNRVAGPRDVVVCAAGSHARRPAQAVAHARPEGLPRRVRLLVHGLRDRRRPRRQAGRARTARSSCWSATART